MTDDELKREAALKLLQAKMEFARFGFHGTLWGGVCSLVAVLLLALIDGCFSITIHASVYVALITACGASTIAFGFFSLWSLPEVQVSADGFIVAPAKGNQANAIRERQGD